MPRQRRAVTGNQLVSEEKHQFARRLRHEMTPQEVKVWEAVRGRRLGGFKFRRQQIIDGYIADFYCAEATLVLELDGSVHDQQTEYDAHRDRVLTARQIVVIRIANDQIDGRFDLVLRKIEALCCERAG